MSQGVTITLVLPLKPEAVDGFCSGMAEAIKETAKRPGFGSIRVVREGAKVALIETWESEAAYDAYIAWRTESGSMDTLAQALAGPPEKTVWPTLVASI
ncbi:putative quinol monooxygenase [Sphingomonas jatrophae]|uniref:Quinol monooxygenase YgiN n=1 Tax=Sphingomonas jatrophae TaxID=1166337 RepID=A0A1I6KZ99_9SPHN|nr:antibiotic biosynthesis monooxygenase [Sphingomonas jatrophae]SFR96534.1 Quinol monooxygenase YgiN [Sphingomonas jatrophae]